MSISISEYTKFIEFFGHANLTQSPQWPIVKKTWNVDRLVSQDLQGGIVGAAQMLTITDSKTGTGFSYIPRGPVCSPEHKEVVEDLIAQAYTIAKKIGSSRLILDPNWDDNLENRNLLAELAEKFSGKAIYALESRTGQLAYDMIGNVENKTYEEWFSTLGSRLRSKIRKAEREGVIVESKHELSLVDRFYDLIVETCARQKISHRPKEYFIDLLEAFPESFFSVGIFDNQIISMAINVPFIDTVYYLYAANSLEYPKLNLPSAMVAETFRESIVRGYKKVNLGAFHKPSEEDFLYKYKRLFTGEEGIKHYVGEIEIYPNS